MMARPRVVQCSSWLGLAVLATVFRVVSPAPVCPPSFCLQPHDDNPEHGDVCRKCAHMVNGGSGPWTCPSTCMRTRHGLSPFCVQTSHEGAPCRAASRKQAYQQRMKKQQGDATYSAASARAALLAQESEWRAQNHQSKSANDACTNVLATVRSGEYLRMAPCAPKRQFYDKQLVPPPEELLNAETLGLTPVGPHAKFYLLDSGPFQLEPRITSCFFDALGGDVASDEFDFLLSPSKVGHLADFALLKSLRESTRRTRDPAQASLFVIGFPVYLSFLASTELESQKACGTSTIDHYQRMDALATALEAHPLFARNSGSDFLLCLRHPNLKRLLGPKLKEVLERGPVILATADRELHPGLEGAAAERQVLQQRAVVIPAKAHFLLDRAADHQPNGYATNKTASFFFQGRFVFRGGSSSASSKKKYKRDSSGSSSSSVTSEGNSREAAFKHFHKLFTDAQVHNVDTDRKISGGASGIDAIKRTSRATVQGYLKSRFCLCPASISTPVPSKRLMEALASGCIPVVLSSFDAAAASLPFRTSIAWSEIAIFAGDLPCFVEHLEGSTANWLRGLVADDEANERRLGCMRRRGQQAFASMLSYGRRSSTNGGSNGGGSGGGGGIGGSGGGSGVVDALMHELDVTGKLKAPAVMPEEMQRAPSQSHSSEGSSTSGSMHRNPWGSSTSSSRSSGSSSSSVAVRGAHLAHFNPFSAAAHNTDTSLSPHAAAEAAARSKGYHGYLPSTAPLLSSSSSSASLSLAPSYGGGGEGGSPWLTSKERAAAVAAANAAASAKRNHLVLVQRLYAEEGFNVRGDFEQWQGTSVLVALRHHPNLHRPFLLCALPGNGDLALKQLMHQASKTKDHQQQQQQRLLDYVGLRLGMDSATHEAKDWGDIATVFGSHTKPPFYKSAMVRDPVTRLLAVYLRHCAPQPSSKKGGATGTSTDNEDEEGQDEFKDGSRSLTEEETTAAAFDPQDQGQGGVENRAAAAAASWWLCHPPAQHFHSEVSSTVTAHTLNRSSFSSSFNSGASSDSLAAFVGRLELAQQPLSHPALRPQLDQCGLRFVRYDAIGRYERFASDSRKMMEAGGVWELTKDQEAGSSSGSLKVADGDLIEVFHEGKKGRSTTEDAEKTKKASRHAHWWAKQEGVPEYKRGNGVASQVCAHYTLPLLQRTYKLYKADFDYFGYRIEGWAEKCKGPWAGEPDATNANTEEDEYADDDDGAAEHHEKALAKAKLKNKKANAKKLWFFW